MNSQATREETTRALEAYPELDIGLPLDFLQSMEPKLDAESLEPVSWPHDPSLEWNPPGHGDVYGSLRSSGMLDAMLDHGLSLRDDLQRRQPRLHHRRAHRRRTWSAATIPFLMEVVRGTEADRKGGHIARRRADRQLVLRETAQTPPEDEESFRDYRRWRYYNTNSLWVDLRALKETLDATGRRARAAADRQPQDGRPARLELAAGDSARERDGRRDRRFKGAQLLCVPRTRFVPVKTTDDLLGAPFRRLHAVAEDMVVAPVPERRDEPAVRRARLEVLQAARRLRAALSRTAHRHCARPTDSSCAVMSPSARAWLCAERLSSSRRSRCGSTPGRRSSEG